MASRRFIILFALLCMIARVALAEPPITAIQFSPEGDRVICVSQRGVGIYAYPELELIDTWQLPWPSAHDVAFSPDGRMLAIAAGVPTEIGGIALLSWPEGKLQKQCALHDDVAYGVAFSADGQWLASASADRHVAILQRADQTISQLVGHSQPVTALTFAGADHLVTAGVDQSLRVWSLPDGHLQLTFENHTAAITDVAQRPLANDEPLMIASAAEDRTVRFWQPIVGRLVRFARLPSVPNCIAWTPAGDRLLAGCRDGHVRTVDPAAVSITADQAGIDGWIYAIAISSDGKVAIVGGERGQLARLAIDHP